MKRHPYFTYIAMIFTAWLGMKNLDLWGFGNMATNDKILMYFDENEPPFDATRWFTNGMYKRRLSKAGISGAQYNDWGMDRVEPPGFPDAQVEDLKAWIMVGLEDDDHIHPKPPASSEHILQFDQGFDPRQQIVYAFSGFKAPDKPFDTYTFYTLLEGRRFYVDIERDALTGVIITANRGDSLIGIVPREKEEALFHELERKQQPGLRARSGASCPYPGVWECDDCELGPQTFSHGVVLPKVRGHEVTWRLVKAL